MSSTSDGNHPILTKFTLEERGEQVEVQPLWVLVHQKQPGGLARYLSPSHAIEVCILNLISSKGVGLCQVPIIIICH